MSFQIDWPNFSFDFLERAKIQITAALNKSNTPSKICDSIQAKELFMVLIHFYFKGKSPPDLEILEIGELSEDRFRGIFKLTYNHDAFIVLETKGR
jgi:distribution and morphology protein 34